MSTDAAYFYWAIFEFAHTYRQVDVQVDAHGDVVLHAQGSFRHGDVGGTALLSVAALRG